MSETVSEPSQADRREAPRAGPKASIARRYAEALFDLGESENAIAAIESDFKALRIRIDEAADFRAFLKSPVYDGAEKEAAMAALVAKAGLHPLTGNFLRLVAKNRRLFVLPETIEAFLTRAAEARGEVAASAVSAAPLGPEQEKALRMEIESMVGGPVNLALRVDPDLLGGLVVKVGSMMIDSSLRTKLNRMKTRMKEA